MPGNPTQSPLGLETHEGGFTGTNSNPAIGTNDTPSVNPNVHNGPGTGTAAPSPSGIDYTGWNWEETLNGVLGLSLPARSDVTNGRWTTVEQNSSGEGDNLFYIMGITWGDNEDTLIFLNPDILTPKGAWDVFYNMPQNAIEPAFEIPASYVRGGLKVDPRTFADAQYAMSDVEDLYGNVTGQVGGMAAGLSSEASQFKGKAGEAFYQLIQNLHTAAGSAFSQMDGPPSYSQLIENAGTAVTNFLTGIWNGYINWASQIPYSPLGAIIQVLMDGGVIVHNGDSWTIPGNPTESSFGDLTTLSAWLNIESMAKSLWLGTVATYLDSPALTALNNLVTAYTAATTGLQPITSPALTAVGSQPNLNVNAGSGLGNAIGGIDGSLNGIGGFLSSLPNFLNNGFGDIGNGIGNTDAFLGGLPNFLNNGFGDIGNGIGNTDGSLGDLPNLFNGDFAGLGKSLGNIDQLSGNNQGPIPNVTTVNGPSVPQPTATTSLGALPNAPERTMLSALPNAVGQPVGAVPNAVGQPGLGAVPNAVPAASAKANLGTVPNAVGQPGLGAVPNAVPAVSAQAGLGAVPNAVGQPGLGAVPNAVGQPGLGAVPNAVPAVSAKANLGTVPNAVGQPGLGAVPSAVPAASAKANLGTVPNAVGQPGLGAVPNAAPLTSAGQVPLGRAVTADKALNTSLGQALASGQVPAAGPLHTALQQATADSGKLTTALNQAAAAGGTPSGSALHSAVASNNALSGALRGALARAPKTGPLHNALEKALTDSGQVGSDLHQALATSGQAGLVGTPLESSAVVTPGQGLIGNKALLSGLQQGPLRASVGAPSVGAQVAGPGAGAAALPVSSGRFVPPTAAGAPSVAGAAASKSGAVPFYPPMMGGGMGGMGGMGGTGGADGSGERERTTWLAEDEDVWGTEPDVGPQVLGRDFGDESDAPDAFEEFAEPTKRSGRTPSREGAAR
jgi:hypothetical protein